MFRIIPRDTRLLRMLEEAAGTVVSAAEAYQQLLANPSEQAERIQAIRQLEHEGDGNVRRTLERLDRTFVTPFDREDIQSLVNLMDDVIDDIDAASKRLGMYRIDQPVSRLIMQGEVLAEACRAVRAAVENLRQIKKPEEIRQHLRRIHQLENAADDTHHTAVTELYDNVEDLLLVMKLKEIHDITERAVNDCEDVANVIEAIILKEA